MEINWKCCKVRIIQKSTKIFFCDIFTWFDRARWTLQNCIFLKFFRPFFWINIFQKPLKKMQKNHVFWHFYYVKKMLDFTRDGTVFHYYCYIRCLKICSFDSAWKTASNDVDFKVFLCDFLEQSLSPTRDHPLKKPVDRYQKCFNSCWSRSLPQQFYVILLAR